MCFIIIFFLIFIAVYFDLFSNKKDKCKNVCNPSGIKDINIIFLDTVHGYFSGVQNTLISIVCGISLASLFSEKRIYNLLESSLFFEENIIFLLKIATTFITICTVWHHYIMHNKYVFWNIRLRDTILPFAWSFTLIMPSAFIDSDKNYYFVIALSLNFFLGLCAYNNSFSNIKKYKNEFKEKFRKVYKDQANENFHECFYDSLFDFHKKKLKLICFYTFMSISSSLFMAIARPNDASLSSIIIYLLHFFFIFHFLKQNSSKKFVSDLKCLYNDPAELFSQIQ